MWIIAAAAGTSWLAMYIASSHRSVAGLAAFWLSRALPSSIMRHLAAAMAPGVVPPSQLGVLALATIATMQWASHDPDARRVARTMAVLAPLDKRRVSRVGGVSLPANHDEAGVSGVWFAEATEDIPHGAPSVSSRLVICLYVHGGGYCGGTPWQGAESHIRAIKRFNALERERHGDASRRLVFFAVDYPLAPDAVWPTQLDYVQNVFVWLNGGTAGERSAKAAQLVFAGDSAGGHCVMHLLMRIARSPVLSSLPLQPRAAILKSPWVDPNFVFPALPNSTDYASKTVNDNFADSVFGLGECADRELIKFPGEKFSLPPHTLVTAGGGEIYVTSIRKFVALLEGREDRGKNLKYLEYAGMPHVFTNVPAIFPSMQSEINEHDRAVGEFIQGSLVDVKEM
ncbi:hypothetical protein HDU84_008991 [Entophlyctis sp. JEL0112]|nr:hypothetical protein HDU84_008991 [Entophlyctis sp. JEL0112]